MSREVAVSAPAKTILLGEHAAVYGHPALVTAVDLRLTAAVRPSGAPGVTIDDVFLPWPEVVALCGESGAPGGRLPFVAVGHAALHAGRAGGSGIGLTVASEIPPGSGLGSSAALAVAVVAATLTHLGTAYDDATVARLALASEKRQHGRPSGVDVQAVLRGGTLWCRRSPEGPLACDALAMETGRLSIFRLAHAGTPAETTGQMVAAVARLAEADPGRVREAMDAIDGATRAAREMLTAAPARDLAALMIPLVRRAHAALTSLGVVPDRVAAAIRAIEGRGGAAKISGAGGRSGGAGLVLVVSEDPDLPDGWTPIGASFGARGLREEVAA